MMENAENLGDGKEIFQPKELENFVKCKWSKIHFRHFWKPYNYVQKAFGGCHCQEGFFNLGYE